MRIPLVALMLALAVPLMGSDCSVAARIGGPPPPPPDGTNPPPPNNGGGGVIIVTSNAPTPDGPTADALRIDPRIVASALAASVWIPPAPKPPVSGSPIRNLDSVAITTAQRDPLIPVELADSQAAAVPEPTGAVIFAVGLAVVAHSLRSRGERA